MYSKNFDLIESIKINRREAKSGVGSVQKIYDELYDKISPDERLGLYTKFVLVNEHGQYLRPMSELSEYFVPTFDFIILNNCYATISIG